MGKDKARVKPGTNGAKKKGSKKDCPILERYRKGITTAGQRRDLALAIIEATRKIGGKPPRNSLLGQKAINDRTKMIAVDAAKALLESIQG